MPEPCKFQTDKLIVRLDVAFKADVNAISPIVDSVLKTARRWHGAGRDASKEVRCCVACDESRGMLIVLSDPGRALILLPFPARSPGNDCILNTDVASTSSTGLWTRSGSAAARKSR